jgi:anaerobic magnesium-protoporphyrin IX monomethyl ester cyclase
MKAVIINSPLFRERNLLYDEDSLPPIGLGYIASHLKRDGIDVQLIDAVDQRIPLSELTDTIKAIQPDFVASNIFTTNYEIVKDLFESLQFKTHFIIGGLSTRQLYSNILSWKTSNPIDIVTGDGELITVDVVRNRVSEQPFFEMGKKRVFKVDTNSKYFVRCLSTVQLDRSFFLNEPVVHPLGFIESNIVTSRGCIYNCTFCAAARSLNEGYSVRENSADGIIKELQDIKRNYPEVQSIRVLDDLFLKNSKTIEKAANVFSHFDFQWRSMAHVMTFKDVDDSLMMKLKESGCYEVFIGIESGSPRILSQIKKTKNVETIIANLSKVLKAGINMKGYFIYGFPGETEDDMEQTYQLACSLKDIAVTNGVNFRTSVFQYRPYHATQIYHELETEGKNLQVESIAPNQALSTLVGRLQFNFHSGNYSAVENQTVHNYIYRTTNLNGGKIFAGLEAGKSM